VRTVISNPLIQFTLTTSPIDIIIAQATPYKKPRIYADYGSQIIPVCQNLNKSAANSLQASWQPVVKAQQADHILDGATDCLAPCLTSFYFVIF
jgi:hypothetical protein